MSNYHYYDPDWVSPPHGLANAGAMCWFNALVQVLLGISSFNKLMVAQKPLFVGASNRFALLYIYMFECARDGIDITGMSARLLAELAVRAPGLGAGQQCADEGFIAFVDAIASPEVEHLFANSYHCEIQCSACHHRAEVPRDTSIRIDIMTASPPTTGDEFYNFIRGRVSPVDSYTCDNCKTHTTTSTRVDRLRALREVVVVMLDKFSRDVIEYFPQTLTFQSTSAKPLVYAHIGTVEHAGTMDSGHYWAQTARKHWHRIDDTNVSPGDPRPNVNSFLVVYHLIDQNGT